MDGPGFSGEAESSSSLIALGRSGKGGSSSSGMGPQAFGVELCPAGTSRDSWEGGTGLTCACGANKDAGERRKEPEPERVSPVTP